MSYFSDFDFTFEEGAADIKIVENEESINQSIKNIILTTKGEVFFDPDFGSRIRQLLFEKMNIITETLLRDEIYYAIENFEPRVDINKVTVFIGSQGSGKSTVAKLISTFMWIEKALVRGDYNKKWFEGKNKLKNQYLNYHRLGNYFSNYDDLFNNMQNLNISIPSIEAVVISHDH